MELAGKVWKFGDNIDTDVIYPAKYLVTFDPQEMARHAMEGVEPGFVENIARGDILVAGRNFGSGSAREQAALALKYAGISAVLAESFARTFYRNAINVGLPVLAVAGIGEAVAQGDRVAVDLAKGVVRNLATSKELKTAPLPNFVFAIIKAGGAVPYYRERIKRK